MYIVPLIVGKSQQAYVEYVVDELCISALFLWIRPA